MLRPSICARQRRLAEPRAVARAGRAAAVMYGATAFCVRSESVLMSRSMYARSNFSMMPR